jgi:hypothetical protein
LITSFFLYKEAFSIFAGMAKVSQMRQAVVALPSLISLPIEEPDSFADLFELIFSDDHLRRHRPIVEAMSP